MSHDLNGWGRWVDTGINYSCAAQKSQDLDYRVLVLQGQQTFQANLDK